MECTLSNIAEELIKEPWIISAVTNEGEHVKNPDIIVTVDKGYEYQVFYNSMYGKVKVEYIGRIDPSKVNPEDAARDKPTIDARYERLDAKIYVTAHHESGIAKIELIRGNEVLATIENPVR